MAISYPDFYTELAALDTTITSAWNNAQSELGTQNPPNTYFLEISWEDGKIRRTYDGSQVSGLSKAEQLRLYPQLNGLFKKAMLALLMP